ncbi:MAG: hypothetical protein N2315_02370 [Thermanaerothrix sp.]|nr:hypothetical protein [Thermanaerothrix sp.]
MLKRTMGVALGALLSLLLVLGFFGSSWAAGNGVAIKGFEWSYDASSGVGRAAVRVQNLSGNRISSPRVAVVLLDSLGNQISSAWGRPKGPYLPARSTGQFVVTLRTSLIPSGVRVMLLDETCGTCGK